MYKYNEFASKEDFEYLNNKYSGEFTYLITLPHGTKFEVHNGHWDGEIRYKDDGVYIHIDKNREIKINEKHSAWIKILKEEN